MERGVLRPQMEPKHNRKPNGDDGEVAELNEWNIIMRVKLK